MNRSMIIVLVVLGILLVIGSLLLRVRSGGKYEVKTTDLVFLVVPLLLVALATGKLKGLDLFGVKADLSALWAEAADTKIESRAEAATATVQDVVHIVELASKGGMNELQRLIERKVEALEFKLGHGGYYGPAIKKYFEALSGSSHLRVIVVVEPGGALFGIYYAPDLISYLRVSGDQGYSDFQNLLNRGNDAARAELAKLPGFLGVDAAVTSATSKRDALASMEQLDADTLPIVDESRRFVGTVERSKLTAKLILAVTDKLASR